MIGPERRTDNLRLDSTDPAIDVHGHYGRYADSDSEFLCGLVSAEAQEIVRRARLARTRVTIVSPLAALMPRRAADPVPANLDAACTVGKNEELLHWVVLDPLKPQTFEQADTMLGSTKCAGIKIHPELHGYSIIEHGAAIFEFAAARHAVILTHSGERNSMPRDFVRFADEFPEAKLILAHLGCGWDGDVTHQVRAVRESKHGNVFTDTSSAKSMTPGLLEWAVREVGAERILYGSDSPCYFAPMQRARIDMADLPECEKRLILYENAAGLFGRRLAAREQGSLRNVSPDRK